MKKIYNFINKWLSAAGANEEVVFTLYAMHILRSIIIGLTGMVLLSAAEQPAEVPNREAQLLLTKFQESMVLAIENPEVTIIWVLGLVCLILPVIYWFIQYISDYKESLTFIFFYPQLFIINNSAEASAEEELELREIRRVSGGEYRRFFNLHYWLPGLERRVFFCTYVWALHVLVMGLCIDPTYLYILVEVGFTNIAFISILSTAQQYLETRDIVQLAKKMPYVMMVPLVYEGIDLLNTTIFTTETALCMCSIIYLILLLYVYRWVSIKIINKK